MPAFVGRVVRLEPMSHDHVDALTAAASEARDTYHWTFVPDGREAMTEFVATAIDGRNDDLFAPFVTVRLDDGRVVGSTRFVADDTYRRSADLALPV